MLHTQSQLYQVKQWLRYDDNSSNSITGCDACDDLDNNWGGVVQAQQQAIRQWYGRISTSNSVITGTVVGASNPFMLSWTASTAGTGTSVITWPLIQTLTNQVYIDASTIDMMKGAPARWTKAQMMRWKRQQEELPKNHRGEVIRTRDNPFNGVSREEVVALQLLRNMVSQEEFRRYLKHGFIVVRGKSGLDYQIRREETIRVWEKGEEIARLCVYLQLEGRPAPPSDHVVAKMLIVEGEEKDIWKRSNIGWMAVDRDRPSLEVLGYADKSKSGIVYNPNGLNVAFG